MEFASKTLIEKGWSSDRKYRAVNSEGEVFLLREMPGAEYGMWLPWYERQKEFARRGVPMCDTLEFGPMPGGGVCESISGLTYQGCRPQQSRPCTMARSPSCPM